MTLMSCCPRQIAVQPKALHKLLQMKSTLDMNQRQRNMVRRLKLRMKGTTAKQIHTPFDTPSIDGESDVEGAEEVVVPVLQETLDIPSPLEGLYRDK